MGKRSSKHRNENTVRLNDFSGGLNLTMNPESISEREVSQAENWEYDFPTGKLKTRDGISLVKNLGVDVESLFYADNQEVFYYSSAGTLYTYAGGSITNIGSLSGSDIPQYAMWDNKVLIASGGTLQSYDGSTFDDTGSPNTNIVFTRAGRVIVSLSGSDKLTYSGVGDETNWVTGIDSDMVEIDIGYKDGGDIISVVNLVTDIVVFKSSGSIFRVVSEYPNWAVYEITRSQLALSRFATTKANNNVFFLTASGFMSLNTVQEYGNVKTSEEGYKVNKDIASIADAGAKIWNIPSKGQIWVRPETSAYIYIFHTLNKAWTKFKMSGTVVGAVSLDNGDNYVAIGQKLYLIDGTTDDGADIVCYFKAKKFVARNDYLIKRMTLNYFGGVEATGSISTGLLSQNFVITSSGDIAFSDDDIAFSDDDVLVSVNNSVLNIRASYRTEYIEMSLKILSGSITIKELILNVVEV